MTIREQRGDSLFQLLILGSWTLPLVVGLVGYWVSGIQQAMLGMVFGFLMGVWMRRSLGLRGPDPTSGFFVRMQERANGSSIGMLEGMIEGVRGNRFTVAKCRKICEAHQEAMTLIQASPSPVVREMVLKSLDRKIKEISYD